MYKDPITIENKLPSSYLNKQRWRYIASSLGFTDRQQEVVKLLVDGCSEEEIGIRLKISSFTVHAHLKSIYKKAEIHTRAELIVKIFLQNMHFRRRKKINPTN